MDRHSRQLLVIITEAVLEKRLVADALRIGAQGYTVHDVRGGSRLGAREALWEADRSIEVKIVCSADVADQVAQHVLATYAPDHALSLYFADVTVVRGEKY
ncbi:MAG: transcriptional regulator [Hydrogenophaga sp.]|jgi:nitrogen regulatory protein P-II 2|uniref:P-II family nitrogen regulator n=1 Tax=Hydrogenophaga sp. TaxID=1904254 RepID=UPI00260D6B9C|nr:transcriptional regulator [Hydrogenophaga sp.]MCV0437586.1 transcriptional regulator [Hydrogenophaga sp.]